MAEECEAKRVELRVRNDKLIESKKSKFILRIYKQENMVKVAIEDNGHGMVEEIRECIFEPFFTTKNVGEGTGLGLSVSYFIITENHLGKMAVESIPG
ncbi:MAG: hypothetical protein KAR38_12465, partial [Calditrichia bacterium]|nr:hypothetical protein [Calditrichia bacterium]